MSYKRKYKCGKPIKTIQKLIDIPGDIVFIKFWEKPCHKAWLFSMQFRIIRDWVDHGNICIAEKI